jgi:hypothetical protein
MSGRRRHCQPLQKRTTSNSQGSNRPRKKASASRCAWKLAQMCQQTLPSLGAEQMRYPTPPILRQRYDRPPSANK